MDGTYIRKVARLAGSLIVNPLYLPRYLRYLPVKGVQPLDVELPWYSFSAIDFLAHHVTSSSVVFEWGGGGSTLFWARRARQVICVESSDTWADRLETVLDNLGVSNVTVLRHYFDPQSKESFKESEYLNCIDDYSADVVVIDGYEESVQLRPLCFYKAESKARSGLTIVLDDSWRYSTVRNKNCANRHVICKSVGPCRYGVTTTDLFFY